MIVDSSAFSYYLNGMLKSEARKLYNEKRKALSIQERVKMDDLLLIQLQKVELPFITFLLSYWPMEQNHEPNTHLFSDFIEFQNLNLILCYPKTEISALEMQAVQTDDDTRFSKNQYNIYEPQNGEAVNSTAMDMIFVPLLSFDKNGNRVGYGKGFYDRYLKGCRKDCLKIGFSYFDPVDEIDDRSDFDVPLDLCVTPTTFYAF